ncbi:MAG: hypothetical protein HXY40_11000 [Chloroflexi bacterium]|nr:hypothetical protein [Chloroflexota bacterium]
MAVGVTWDNEQHTILLYTFTDPWNWDDYDEAVRHAYALLESTPNRVATIIDFSCTQTLPRGAIKHMSIVAQQPHPKQSMMLIVGASPFIQAISNILASAYPGHGRVVHHVKTLAQARALAGKRFWMRGFLRHIYG